jgi:CheY-specific phosphatase CheX
VIFGSDKNSAQMISPQVFGMEIDDEDKEMFMEFAKEMLNIISGNCKTQLSAAGINFGISIPEIVSPDNPAQNLTDKKNFIKRSFDFEGSKIELLISNNSEK